MRRPVLVLVVLVGAAAAYAGAIGLSLAARAGPGELLVMHAPRWSPGDSWAYLLEREGVPDERLTFQVLGRGVVDGVEVHRARVGDAEHVFDVATLDRRFPCEAAEFGCGAEPLVDFPLVNGETRAWQRGGDVVSFAVTTTRVWGDHARVTHRVDGGRTLVYEFEEGAPYFTRYATRDEVWTLER